MEIADQNGPFFGELNEQLISLANNIKHKLLNYLKLYRYLNAMYQKVAFKTWKYGLI